MAPRLENRSEQRAAATEREKSRMKHFNIKVDQIRTLVCPSMKSATKAKVLKAAVDRLIHLESIAANMAGQTGSEINSTCQRSTIQQECYNYQEQTPISFDSLTSQVVDYSQTYNEFREDQDFIHSNDSYPQYQTDQYNALDQTNQISSAEQFFKEFEQELKYL